MTDKTPSREQCVVVDAIKRALGIMKKANGCDKLDAQAAVLRALIDPENQPNQYGVVIPSVLRPAPQPSGQRAEQMVDGPTICEGCSKKIDPDTCGCGDSITHDAWNYGHAPIPMGCDCYRTPTASTATPSKGPESPDNEPGVREVAIQDIERAASWWTADGSSSAEYTAERLRRLSTKLRQRGES